MLDSVSFFRQPPQARAAGTAPDVVPVGLAAAPGQRVAVFTAHRARRLADVEREARRTESSPGAAPALAAEFLADRCRVAVRHVAGAGHGIHSGQEFLAAVLPFLAAHAVR